MTSRKLCSNANAPTKHLTRKDISKFYNYLQRTVPYQLGAHRTSPYLERQCALSSVAAQARLPGIITHPGYRFFSTIGPKRKEFMESPAGDPEPTHRVLQRRKTKADIEYYFSSQAQKESVKAVKELNIDSLPSGEISCLWVQIVSNSFGAPVSVPVMVARGPKPGPVFGLVAALHGNEVSGIPIIQKIFHDLAPYVSELSGTVMAVVCVNQHGFENSTRFYLDGSDLNRAFPGKEDGARGQQFAHAFFHKIIKQMNYMVDLHTASFGRANSFYVRATMTDPTIARMARLIRPTIIVHNAGQGGDGGGGTLRAAAMANNIKAVCIEIGDPLIFQSDLIFNTYMGIARVIDDIGMLRIPEVQVSDNRPDPIVCKKSYWMQTDVGGILVVRPKVGELIKKGTFIASVVDIFGFVSREYVALEDGVVVGKSTNPSNRQGDRILHLGVVCGREEFNEDGTIQLSAKPL